MCQCWMRAQKGPGGAADPMALFRGDGFDRQRLRAPGLHFDERDQISALGDDVNLADRGPIAAVENAVAAKSQMPD